MTNLPFADKVVSKSRIVDNVLINCTISMSPLDDRDCIAYFFPNTFNDLPCMRTRESDRVTFCHARSKDNHISTTFDHHF